ncbi:MAG: hypothetical protein ACRC7S_14045 [Cetobacterium sp.]
MKKGCIFEILLGEFNKDYVMVCENWNCEGYSAVNMSNGNMGSGDFKSIEECIENAKKYYEIGNIYNSIDEIIK